MSAVRAGVLRSPRGRALNAGSYWLLGSVFAVLDALTTWYAIRAVHAEEGNPATRWAIANLGMTGALVVRVLVGCGALGLLAFGVSARLPRHRRLVNQACQVLLTGAVVLWGAAALSNAIQVVWLKMA